MSGSATDTAAPTVGGRLVRVWGPAAAVLLAYVTVYWDLVTCKKIFSHDSLVWYGTFHFYLDSMTEGVFPYWDPYMLTGTPFYPNISGYGLLDPIVLVCVLLAKLWDISPVTLFIYFRIYRLLFFSIGAFLLFRYLTRSSLISAISAGILLFITTYQNNHQPMMDYGYTIPLAFYFTLLFLDNRENARRYRYLFGLALVTGITMNVFIPTLYLFMLMLFLCALFLFGRYRLKEVLHSLAEKRLLLAVGAAVLFVAMMTAPPLMVSLIDTTQQGELFPIGKLVDSNNGKFKVLSASDMEGDVFFDKMRNNAAAFISTGSLLSLIVRDMSSLRLFSDNNTLIISLYIGILPLIVILFGLFRGRSPLRFAVIAVTVVLFLSMFSFRAVNDTFNAIQLLMNALFPPLRMIDMRINFASALSFCLCLLLSLAAADLSGPNGIEELVRRRFGTLLLLCAVLVAVKIGINVRYGGAVFLGMDDAVFLIALAAAVGGVIAVRRQYLSGRLFIAAMLVLSFADIIFAGTRFVPEMKGSDGIYMFVDNEEYYEDNNLPQPERFVGNVEYFRVPFSPVYESPLPAFIGTILQTKGAVISNPDIVIFTTKRYYDLFSQLPLETQLVLDGVIFPIVRFFPPEDTVTVNGRCGDIDMLQQSSPLATYVKLIVERDAACPRNQTTFDLKAHPDLAWFGTRQFQMVYQAALPTIKDVRARVDLFLTNSNSMIRLDEVSVNEARVEVRNTIDGYLLYNDGWSRYWKAYDNGREVPLRIANYNSKAVFLPAGSHEVRFVYSPVHYQVGLVLFYAGLVLSASAVLYFSRAG